MPLSLSLSAPLPLQCPQCEQLKFESFSTQVHVRLLQVVGHSLLGAHVEMQHALPGVQMERKAITWADVAAEATVSLHFEVCPLSTRQGQYAAQVMSISMISCSD